MFLHPIVIHYQSPLCACAAWYDKKKKKNQESQINAEFMWHKKKVGIMGNTLFLIKQIAADWIFQGEGYVGKRRMNWITLCNEIRIQERWFDTWGSSLSRGTGYESKDQI